MYDEEQFGLELEAKFQHSKHVPAKDLDEFYVRENIRKFQWTFSMLKQNKCSQCKYPLPLADNHALPELGDVCNLCYHMYTAIFNSKYFTELHRIWKARQDRNKKIIEDK